MDKSLRDLILVATAATLFFSIPMWLGAKGHWSADEFGRWSGLIFNTAIVFGLLGNKYFLRRHTSRLLWVMFGASLLVHCIFFGWILSSVNEWKVVWFMVITPLEHIVLSIAMARVDLGTGGRARRK